VSRYFAGYYNIIPNGIDYEFWSRPREPWPEFQDGKKNILFVGRPEKRKGLKYLLRAYMQLRECRDDTRLIIVGAGNFLRYQRLMKGYGDVVFRPNVPYEDLPRFHYTADVMCCPNTGGESQGYVLMEALATGLPVVASNIEGFAGVVTDGLDAVLVPPKTEEPLADALNALLDDPERRRELGSHGQRRAEDYSWDKVARRVLSYYERILHEHHVLHRESQTVADSVAR
jgi:phosphatidyl-myo-inositol alpha-mannosyltransferase